MDGAGSFDRLVPLLHKAPVRTIALDLRGHGDSGWVGAGGFYHFAEYFADIDGILDALGLAMPIGKGEAVLEPVRLVGHSMGASLSLLYAAIKPARISHVAMLDGMPFTVLSSEVPGRLVEYLEDLKSISRHRRTVASIEQAAERLRKTSPNSGKRTPRCLLAVGRRLARSRCRRTSWPGSGIRWLRAHSPLPFTEEVLEELLPLIRAKIPDRARRPRPGSPKSPESCASTSRS